jgi:D-serine dehydratase
VQSRPEPQRALLGLGKRDASYDAGLPVPQLWFRQGVHEAPQRVPDGHRVVAMNDQHAYLDLPADSPLAVGDMIGLGISHPCLTFDKWQVIPVVDDSYNIVSAIRTFF